MAHRPIVGVLSACVWLAACDPFHTELGTDDVVRREATEVVPAPSAPSALRVATWNIKFAGGRIDFFWDCFGDRVLMERSEVETNLAALAAAIDQLDVDVLFVQELDLNSKRTDHLDQLQWLLDHTDLSHGVYGSGWRADYVPSDGLGAIDNGSAILSRFPIEDPARIPLALRSDQSAIERYFYLRRHILTANVRLGPDRTLAVANLHTSAYGTDGTKLSQIERFHELLTEWDAAGIEFLAGGDLNTLPPGTAQQRDFPDTVCEDEEFIADDYTLEADWAAPLYRDFAAAIPLAEYQADNAAHFTHTVDGRGFWNRKLDYLFTNLSFDTARSQTHLDMARGGIETMPLSDHAPVSAVLELGP